MILVIAAIINVFLCDLLLCNFSNIVKDQQVFSVYRKYIHLDISQTSS